MTIQEHFEHLEKEAAMRAAKDAQSEQAGEMKRNAAEPGLRDTLLAMLADARAAASRYDAINQLLHLLERNPQITRILELGQKLDLL
jgi:hypothetical protein